MDSRKYSKKILKHSTYCPFIISSHISWVVGGNLALLTICDCQLPHTTHIILTRYRIAAHIDFCVLDKKKTIKSYQLYFLREIMKLRAFCDVLEKLAPTWHAAKWDNVGLLLEPANCFVERVLLTNDLTSRVMQEAVDFKGMFSFVCKLTYHVSR